MNERKNTYPGFHQASGIAGGLICLTAFRKEAGTA